MSKYTTEVRFICETNSGLSESKGYNNIEEVIENSRAKIFDFSYPIYDESYRSVLETKILKHFYTREIGAETVGLWKLWLNTRMNEIMPYYNELYKSATLEYNPLYDVDITTTKNGTIDGNKNDTGTNTGNTETDVNSTNVVNRDSWDYYSDTPQGGITGLSTNSYLTNATHDTVLDSGSGTNHSEATYTDNRNNMTTFNNTESYVEHVAGKRGGDSYSKMIKDYRDVLINIDLKIIHELDDLFLNLW